MDILRIFKILRFDTTIDIIKTERFSLIRISID